MVSYNITTPGPSSKNFKVTPLTEKQKAFEDAMTQQVIRSLQNRLTFVNEPVEEFERLIQSGEIGRNLDEKMKALKGEQKQV